MRESFEVEFNLRSVIYAKVVLVSFKGEEAAVLHEDDITPGQRMAFSATGYAAGLYFIKLAAKDVLITTKLVLKK